MNELEKFPYLEQEMDKFLLELESVPQDKNIALEAYALVKGKLGISGLPYRIKTASRWIQRIAAILFIPAVIAVSVLLSINKSNADISWAELSVPAGQTREVTLPDGSDLILNSGSRVTYPSKFSRKSRDIFFDGEVYARVMKDPEKPFIIHSKGIDVKVLGTTFNFKSYDYSDYAELLLLEGSVQMDIESKGTKKTYSLSPGDLLQHQRSTGVTERKGVNANTYKPFSEDGSLHFYNVPMKEIALELERKFGTKIVIRDKTLEDTRFLAFFTNNETLDDILDSFCADSHISAIRSDGIVYIGGK